MLDFGGFTGNVLCCWVSRSIVLLRHELAGNSADWEVEKEGPLGVG